MGVLCETELAARSRPPHRPARGTVVSEPRSTDTYTYQSVLNVHMASVPAEYQSLISGGVYGTIGTVDADGAPLLTPIWIDYEADRNTFVVNTVPGREKEQHLRQNPAVGLTYVHEDDERRYLSVQGEAVEFLTDGAIKHYNRLAENLLGESDFYDRRYEEDVGRILIRIEPHRVYSR
jgi:PPOX class probable F420-dependent enzyme